MTKEEWDRQLERECVVKDIVEEVDSRILAAADAQREEIILLTAMVAKEMADKIIYLVKLDAERKRITDEYIAIMEEPVVPKKVARHSDWSGGDVRGPGIG